MLGSRSLWYLASMVNRVSRMFWNEWTQSEHGRHSQREQDPGGGGGGRNGAKLLRLGTSSDSLKLVFCCIRAFWCWNHFGIRTWKLRCKDIYFLAARITEVE